ncbi:MAG: hypothetical protein IJZ79_02615 [Bacilli bacterium]|nr:hypothetical protein [Bacilli bacterium]MBQ8218617.1 hypothetical protein [Bacilli bacterium]
MRIKSIEMVNWKCFEHKKVDFDDRFTMFNWKNGEGKTSLIQAIVLCLFDKRPDNLDYASLVNIEKPTKLVLHFVHNASTYIVEREVGKTSSFKLYKNESLIGRTNKECKEALSKIIPESVLTSLWGYESLSVSNVLSSSYLYSVLENEFLEPLSLKQHFTSDRSYQQKQKSALERTITNTKITKEELEALKKEIDDIEAKIKEKAFVSDSDVIKAKRAKEDYEEYLKVKAELDACPKPAYDRETCIKLKAYGKTQEEWDAYFKKLEEDLSAEKAKSKASPLIKYPKNVIHSLITESKCNDGKCILCGNTFVEPKLEYDTIDNDKIQRIEAILKEREEKEYSFDKLIESMKYWHFIKRLEPLKYVETFDFQSILDSYNEETNKLYALYDQKRNEYTVMHKDFAKISELLTATEIYNQDKKCIEIVDEYIEQAKAHYASEIVKSASDIIKQINTRYTEILIENGVYKARLYDKDFKKESVLAVQSLSKGEKTIVALSLILSIRNLFMSTVPLIMDESFSNLDADNVAAIRRIVHEDTSQWIIVSHDERLL